MVVDWCPLKYLAKCAGLPEYLSDWSSSQVRQEHGDAISKVDYFFQAENDRQLNWHVQLLPQ